MKTESKRKSRSKIFREGREDKEEKVLITFGTLTREDLGKMGVFFKVGREGTRELHGSRREVWQVPLKPS